MKHKKNLPQEILEIFPQMLKAGKNWIKKIFFGEAPTPKNSSSLNKESELYEVTVTGRAKQSNEPVAVKAEDYNIMQKELRDKAGQLHYLLDATAARLIAKNRRTDETFDSLAQKWEYMLDVTDCDKLLVKFSTIKSSAQNNEKLVRKWDSFLKKLGLVQFVARDEEIILSRENRGFFENGRIYKDGKRLFVDKYPWLLNGELIVRGELYGED